MKDLRMMNFFYGGRIFQATSEKELWYRVSSIIGGVFMTKYKPPSSTAEHETDWMVSMTQRQFH